MRERLDRFNLVSIHAPRAGCDLVRLDSHARLEVFQFTHPVRGATAQGRRNLCSLHCFNSRTPCGVRRRATEATRTAVAFQFTHPVRGATFLFNRAGVALPVSIHAPRAGCDGGTSPLGPSAARVSIHAPRAGCDLFNHQLGQLLISFNSRTPCGVRLCIYNIPASTCMFQFTHPVRGATLRRSSARRAESGFNSRTPCGVRRGEERKGFGVVQVSIHAPRAGCDTISLLRSPVRQEFQFTHPVRGATIQRYDSPSSPGLVSIHAPRAGCDNKLRACLRRAYVSIHAPRAGCDNVKEDSTKLEVSVSIHAPRAGCDIRDRIYELQPTGFNSRTPCGVRPLVYDGSTLATWFQFTHPVRGATE